MQTADQKAENSGSFYVAVLRQNYFFGGVGWGAEPHSLFLGLSTDLIQIMEVKSAFFKVYWL